ncbi:translation initiation factor IF-2-like [Eptesicus fuscus]|uniref:translation initiation factor IF-2-like n=1 Tax=Eptesicus fuscus TaxID=29078 RepID=UPI002403C451|nr:translation initiation factor IF-2-like [Eptesicus fuscus]
MVGVSSGRRVEQEARNPGGQRSHDLEPFKPSRPRQPRGGQRPLYPRAPTPPGGAPDPTSRAPRPLHASRTGIPPATPTPQPSAGATATPERLCAAAHQPALRPRDPRPPSYRGPSGLAGAVPSSPGPRAAGGRSEPEGLSPGTGGVPHTGLRGREIYNIFLIFIFWMQSQCESKIRLFAALPVLFEIERRN